MKRLHSATPRGLALAACLALFGCTDDERGEDAPDAGGSGADGGGAGDGGAGDDAGTTGDGGPDAAPGDRAVTLRFKAKLGDRDFECGQTYSGVGSSGATVTPMDLRFYVEEVWLTSGTRRTRVTLDERAPWQTPDVALLDFEDGAGQCGNGNRQLNAEITGKAPRGSYDGVEFVVGVPETLNHVADDRFPPPLQPIYMLWSWLAGFKFFVAEVIQVQSSAGQTSGDGGAEAGGAGEAGIPGSGVLHVGSTGCYATDGGDKRCVHSNRARVTLSGFDLDTDVVTVDVGSLFDGVDLRVDQSCHSTGASCPALFDALGLDFDTGRSGGPQRVFGRE